MCISPAEFNGQSGREHGRVTRRTNQLSLKLPEIPDTRGFGDSRHHGLPVFPGPLVFRRKIGVGTSTPDEGGETGSPRTKMGVSKPRRESPTRRFHRTSCLLYQLSSLATNHWPLLMSAAFLGYLPSGNLPTKREDRVDKRFELGALVDRH